MELTMLRCPECGAGFAVDREVVEDEEVLACPRCEADVDCLDDTARLE